MNRLIAAWLTLCLAIVPCAAFANDLNASSWSETDSSNNSASPNGWTSGTMIPSQVEPTARAMMGAIKRWHDQVSPALTAGGTANALTLTHTVSHSAYAAGDLFGFIAASANTGSATLNVDGLGAKTLKVGSASLIGGEIQAGAFVLAGYDGTNMQLLRAESVIGQLLGTPTNDSACAGCVGEFVTANVAATTTGLSSATPTSLTSISLTPGDWDVRGVVCVGLASTTTLTQLAGSINTTTGTLATKGTEGYAIVAASFGVGLNDDCLDLSPRRLSLNSTTTVFLVIFANFGTSTAGAYGTISGRRVR